jgi:DNA-binding FrmR family transcriptional regulator
MVLMEQTKEQMQRNVVSRLRKIEGQVRGLQGMIVDGKECEDILIQVRAVQSALKSVGALVLKAYLLKCYSEISEKPDPEELFSRMNKMVDVLGKFIGG